MAKRKGKGFFGSAVGMAAAAVGVIGAGIGLVLGIGAIATKMSGEEGAPGTEGGGIGAWFTETFTKGADGKNFGDNLLGLIGLGGGAK